MIITKQQKLPYRAILVLVLLIFAFTLLFIRSSHYAEANRIGGKFSHTKGKTKTLYWYYYGKHRYNGNAWFGAQEGWKGRAARINPKKQGNSGTVHIHLRDVNAPKEEYWAVTGWVPCIKCTYTNAVIDFNPSRLDKESDFTRSKVATHEFGHAFGLAHTPYNASYKSVMKQGRLKYKIPQTYDKKEINSLYK